MSLQWPLKDKDETLDYSLDWSRVLNTGETILSVVWYIVNAEGEKVLFSSGSTVDGITNFSQSNTSTVATLYLSQGQNNKKYKFFCAVTTSASRTIERVVSIKIREYN